MSKECPECGAKMDATEESMDEVEAYSMETITYPPEDG